MKNTKKIFQSAAMLFLTLLVWTFVSCATVSAPQLENRTLRLSPDISGFEYQYEVCDQRILGICVKHKMVKDIYDLSNLEIRKKLIDMGFVLKVREKP